MSLLPQTLAAASTEVINPSGGAPLTQLLLATAFAGAMTIGVLVIAWLHRTGRTQLLTKAGAWVGNIEGVPGWAAIPSLIGYGSLLLAFLGVYWDISLHLDNGRDPGPLANLAHYPIMIGLQGLFLAGVLALVMPAKNSYVGPSAVKIAPGWRVPTASLTLMACAVLGYSGFPLDDVWHRLFGQDVTLWGPTHLMMITGAVLSIVALALLQVEGERAYGKPKNKSQAQRRKFERLSVPVALLIAGSLYLGEWDWGVQQYLMIWQPLLLAAIAGFGLVLARKWGGIGFAILAAGGYAAMRFGMDLIVGYGFGQSMPTMPLFFVEAVIVEALLLSPSIRKSVWLSAITVGLGIGTIGFAAQYGWTQIAMPTAWTTGLIGQGVPMAIVGASAGAMIGWLFAASLDGELAAVNHRRWLGLGAAATLLGLAGIAGNQDYSDGGIITAQVTGERQVEAATGTGPGMGAVRNADVTVRFQNPADAEGAAYVATVAWQGGGLVTDVMKKVGPGVYRTTEPIPLGGQWKTMVRMQSGRRLLAVPVELPADPGIPVPAVKNDGSPTQFRTEQQLMQRERKPDVPAGLWMPAMTGVLGLMGLFAIALGFATARVGLRTKREPGTATNVAAAGPDPLASGDGSTTTREGRPVPATNPRAAH